MTTQTPVCHPCWLSHPATVSAACLAHAQSAAAAPACSLRTAQWRQGQGAAAGSGGVLQDGNHSGIAKAVASAAEAAACEIAAPVIAAVGAFPSPPDDAKAGRRMPCSPRAGTASHLPAHFLHCLIN